MEDREILLTLSRILSGYYIVTHDKKHYKIKYPDAHVKYFAELVSQEELEKNKFCDWFRLDDITNWMISINYWSKEEEDFLEGYQQTSDNLKVEIFQNFRNPTALQSFRKKLASHNKIYSRLYQKKHSFDYVTLEGYCDQLKDHYLLLRSIYDENDNLIFLTEENEHKKFDEIATSIMNHAIPMSSYREIARSNQWAYYWNNVKGDLFDKPIIEWTDEQRVLSAMSRMYDSAREHPDCPDDDVFEDDDAFDGWLISERRKHEKEKAKSRAEKMLPGKLGKAQDVFVQVHNRHQAKDIYSLNDIQGKSVIRERQQTIERAGSVKEQNLPDIQRDLIIESNQKRVEMMRKRK